MGRAIHVAKLVAFGITASAGVLVMLGMLLLAVLATRGGGGG